MDGTDQEQAPREPKIATAPMNTETPVQGKPDARAAAHNQAPSPQKAGTCTVSCASISFAMGSEIISHTDFT